MVGVAVAAAGGSFRRLYVAASGVATAGPHREYENRVAGAN